MSVKLITENILRDDHFLSATEQVSEYIGQPVITGASTGGFRLLSSGDIADFTYDGTATDNGLPGGTTVIDLVLAIYGDDYFIGGTVEMTGGTCDGETRAVTGFAQATGTLTTAAFTAQIDNGDTFTLTIAFATRDFDVELVAGGDTGDATFKWSHDGGTTYLGRDNPDQADWLGVTTVVDNPIAGFCVTVQCANNDLVACFLRGVDSHLHRRISTDGGITWGSDLEISANTYAPRTIVKDGDRLLLYADTYVFYSDDNGVTWSEGTDTSTIFNSIIKSLSGNFVGVYEVVDAVFCRISTDGFIWGTSITVAQVAENQGNPAACLNKNGDIVCVYQTDEASVGDYEIKAKISTDSGTTWGSTIDVIDFVADDLLWPRIIKDIDGTLYAMCEQDSGDKKIVFAASSDGGITWGAQKDLIAEAVHDMQYIFPFLLDNHQVVASYYNLTDTIIETVRRGIWEAFAANACPCALEAVEQKLICNVGIMWHGGEGIAADHWDFEVEYSYAMENLIADSPSKPWRSEQDNIECSIVIDLGANNRFFADSVAFFGANIKVLTFQMNDADAWVGPPIDETVSFDLNTTGVVDSISGNTIEDAALLANYDDHFFKGDAYYLRATNGPDAGRQWRILDNVEDFLFLDTTAGLNMVMGNTFDIQQGWIAHTFDNMNVYQYIRIHIPAQQTAEDYYQLGVMVAGRAVTLTDRWGPGYGKDHRYDVDMLRTPQGGLISVKNAGRKRIFTLTWPFSDGTRKELIALLDCAEGRNIALIPDDSVLTDTYLTKLIGSARQARGMRDRFDLRIVLEEIL